MITHETKVFGRCPVDGKVDSYDVTITTRRFIKVEDILATIDEIQSPVFQEAMTQLLADKLGCNVRSVGYHTGVKTTCEV